MRNEKVEMNGEEPYLANANKRIEKLKDLKVAEFYIGYDGSIWATIPEYDES